MSNNANTTASAASDAEAPATTSLIPTRDLAWGEKTLKKDKPFDFPDDVVQTLLDAEVVTRPVQTPAPDAVPAKTAK